MNIFNNQAASPQTDDSSPSTTGPTSSPAVDAPLKSLSPKSSTEAMHSTSSRPSVLISSNLPSSTGEPLSTVPAVTSTLTRTGPALPSMSDISARTSFARAADADLKEAAAFGLSGVNVIPLCGSPLLRSATSGPLKLSVPHLKNPAISTLQPGLRSAISEDSLLPEDDLVRLKRRKLENQDDLEHAVSIMRGDCTLPNISDPTISRLRKFDDTTDSSLLDEFIFTKRPKRDVESSSRSVVTESLVLGPKASDSSVPVIPLPSPHIDEAAECVNEPTATPTFVVHLDTVLGTSFALEVTATQTLEDLRFDASDATGIIYDEIMFVFNGVELLKKYPLSTQLCDIAHLVEGSRLKMLVKLTGGPLQSKASFGHMSATVMNFNPGQMSKLWQQISGALDDPLESSNNPETFLFKLSDNDVIIVNLKEVTERGSASQDESIESPTMSLNDEDLEEDLAKLIAQQEQAGSDLEGKDNPLAALQSQLPIEAVCKEPPLQLDDAITEGVHAAEAIEPLVGLKSGLESICLSSEPVTGELAAVDKKVCVKCRKRLRFANTFACKCGGVFCSTCRYANVHNCTFDYHREAQLDLLKRNPLIAPDKLR